MKIRQFLFLIIVSCFAACADSAQREQGEKEETNKETPSVARAGYYSNISLQDRGEVLKNKLSTLITHTHTHMLSYSEIWEVLKKCDEDPKNPGNVLLLYGSETSGKYARTRSKELNGGAAQYWNREHTFAKSLGTPNLGISGPGADSHHIRPADVELNANRGNLRFDDGQGKKAYRTSRGGWYPGEEWKGDVARMMMYMYVRYGERCAATSVGMNPYTYSKDFPDIFIKWNIEDPVSDFERKRNNVIAGIQGNRNPFIDNPYLATLIWGGPSATNTWGKDFSAKKNETKNKLKPYALKVESITATSFELSWQYLSEKRSETSFDIYLNGEKKITTATTAATLRGLTPGKVYAIYIVARNDEGQSSQSETFSVTTLTKQKKMGGSEEALFSEDFNHCGEVQFNTINNEGNVSWQCVPKGGHYNTGAYQISAHQNGANLSAEAWLINKSAINLNYATQEKLKFYSKSRYGTSHLKVRYSLDYDGEGDPKNFSWIDVPLTTGEEEINGDFIKEITVDIGDIEGNKVFIAFVYQNPAGVEATEWTVDDFKITGVVNEGENAMAEVEGLTLLPSALSAGEENKILVEGRNLETIKWLKIFNTEGKLVKEIINPFLHEKAFYLPSNLRGTFIVNTPENTNQIVID